MDRLGGNFGPHEMDDHLDYDVGEDVSTPEPPPSPVGQDERRMQVRAYNHWASQLGDRNFPHIGDLAPEELEDFGPYSVLLDFTGSIEDPVVRYLGESLARECEAAEPIERLADVPSRSLLSRITDHYMQILANQAPIGFEAEYVNERGATILYRGILLPYSSDNETIDYIYGVINWKEMADQKTADELLLEIDQALGTFEGPSTGHDTDDAASFDVEDRADALSLLDGTDTDSARMTDDFDDDPLPQPRFGSLTGAPEDEDEGAYEDTSFWGRPVDRGSRAVDALGNPLSQSARGLGLDDEHDDEIYEGIKTAADYGLPEWDDEEGEDEDVDVVVDPLADEEASSNLTSLVNRGTRTKKSVDLSYQDPLARIPQPYEGEGVALPEFAGFGGSPSRPWPIDEAGFARPGADGDGAVHASYGSGFETRWQSPQELPDEETGEFALPSEDSGADEALRAADEAEHSVHSDGVETFEAEEFAGIAGENDGDLAEAAPDGLYDCLAAAREMAQAAQNTEDRSRKALYAAVSRAYDFSLEAQASPADFEELVADSGLTVQDRAPMTPVVKLVFGADYDKTRLTEYAAVLMHAHRLEIERGSLGAFLHAAEGGLKGVVNAERRARKEEQGKTVEGTDTVRASLARKLRLLPSLSFAELGAEGPEFALVMVRRTPEGELVVLGEMPEDVPQLEKAARKLLG